MVRSCNLNQTDRGVRFLLGLGLLVASLWYRSLWGLLGLLLLASAMSGYCGVYRLLGLSTYKPKA